MIMRDIGSFHCPEPRFISRGAAAGNKHGQGLMVSDTLHSCPFIKFALVELFHEHVNP